MKQRGADPAIADANPVLVIDPNGLDTTKSLKELMRDGKVWILKPAAKNEQDQMREMLAGSGACREST
jgi:hypothetical protein